MAMVISDSDQKYSIFGASGTSASTPLWAALIALANQSAGHDLSFVNPAIYRAIYRVGRSASRHAAFHDVTTGNVLTALRGGSRRVRRRDR
jgi:subtilase family serine protease